MGHKAAAEVPKNRVVDLGKHSMTQTDTRRSTPALAAAQHKKKRKPNAHITFVREFIRNPAATAAIAPSSRKLCERMIEGFDVASCRTVVEYGPGSGVMTRVVLERIPKGWEEQGRKFLAIEYNPTMAAVVHAEFPRATVINDSAANVERIIGEHGIAPGSVDLVVSGLGWASFPPNVTTEILEATARVLKPGGEFRTFAYHIGLVKKSAWHLRAEMKRLFGDVRTTRSVWANLPPAFVYVCKK